MSIIETRVRDARRRLILARFAHLACWSLCVAWMVAAVAIVARGVWVLPIDVAIWDWSWLGGTTLIATIVSAVVSVVTAPSQAKVASELDSRCGLRERLSSAVLLTSQDRDTAMGQALLQDATRRVEPVDVREHFSLSPSRIGWLPAVPAAVVALAMFIVPAIAPTPPQELDSQWSEQTTQVKTAAESLKRKLQQQRQRAEESGLKEAEEFFKKLESDLDKLATRTQLDQKDAMIAMNDIQKQLQQRRDELGTPEQMKSALAKMEDVDRGPAGGVVKAMQKGDFDAAQKQVKELAEKLRDGKLTQQEQQQLRQQMEQIRDQLNQAAEKNEAAKQQLQQQIDQAKKEGRGEDAAKMENQMQQLEAQGAQMQQMQQIAEAMAQAAQAMQDGKLGEAADALDNLSDQLGDMQAEMQQLEDLKDTLQDIAQTKDQMRCSSCTGEGCSQCKNGQGSLKQQGGAGGKGYGTGVGRGDGEEEEIDAGTYDSQVRGEPKRGGGVITGFADGPNRKGVSRQEVKDVVLGAIHDKSDPLENQTLPRVERDHTREYFDRLRKGERP